MGVSNQAKAVVEASSVIVKSSRRIVASSIDNWDGGETMGWHSAAALSWPGMVWKVWQTKLRMPGLIVPRARAELTTDTFYLLQTVSAVSRWPEVTTQCRGDESRSLTALIWPHFTLGEAASLHHIYIMEISDKGCIRVITTLYVACSHKYK